MLALLDLILPLAGIIVLVSFLIVQVQVSKDLGRDLDPDSPMRHLDYSSLDALERSYREALDIGAGHRSKRSTNST